MVKKKVKTVSEKITEAIAREVDDSSSSEDVHEKPRVEQEFDEYDVPDTRTTEIRKRNVKLLSEQSVRYSGKITSRSELEQEFESTAEEEEEEAEEYSTDDEALRAYSTKLKSANYGSAQNESDSEVGETEEADDTEEDSEDYESAEEAEEGDTDEDDEDDDEDEDEEEEKDATDIIAESNRQAEIQKGQCVQNQLRIWERLLELRIHTQKLLSKANQLPNADTLKTQASENDKLAKVCSNSCASVSVLLNSLLELQSTLCKQFSEQRNAMKQTLKRALPIEETGSNNEPPLKRFAEHLTGYFEEFHPHRNAVLLKWDDRTKLLTPGAGAKRKSLVDEYDIVKKIDAALQQRSALIKRSQTPKAVQANATEQNAALQTPNVEIYDDSDFYHQQLRELIEYKANTSANASEVTQQYVELQKLRQKMKKKVDQRASKGRKLRYTVHNKLVNFMAPDDKSSWTEESRNELYKSLFAA